MIALPFNTILKPSAGALRKNMTDAESAFVSPTSSRSSFQHVSPSFRQSLPLKCLIRGSQPESTTPLVNSRSTPTPSFRQALSRNPQPPHASVPFYFLPTPLPLLLPILIPTSRCDMRKSRVKGPPLAHKRRESRLRCGYLSKASDLPRKTLLQLTPML